MKLTDEVLCAVGLHVHDKEIEHILGARWPWREGWCGRLGQAHDSGAHPAAPRLCSRRDVNSRLDSRPPCWA